MKFTRCKFYVQHKYVNRIYADIDLVSGYSFTHGEGNDKRTLYIYTNGKYWYLIDPGTGLIINPRHKLYTTRRDAIASLDDTKLWEAYIKLTDITSDRYKGYDKMKVEFEQLCYDWEVTHT